MLAPPWRRLVLACHLTVSVGWVGGAVVYVVLAVVTATTSDAGVARAGWVAMDVAARLALVPLAVLSLASGVLLALGTRWGLLQHYWVVVSLVGTTVCTAVLVLHVPSVSATAETALHGDDATALALGSDLLHSTVGLALLLGILFLNVYKPAGLTRRGWQRQQRAARRS